MRQQPATWWQDVLAVIRFDGAAAAAPPPEMPLTVVNAPVLAGADSAESTGGAGDTDGARGAAEVWRLAGPMHSGQHGRVRYRHNGRLLFASLSIAEAEFAEGALCGAATALRRATEPAASAVGVGPASPLTIYCIAGPRAPIALENPRQCSAWDYPPQYGPRSPTFARACISSDAAQTLFISGTASIVGHASAHAGDQREQTREIVRNIRALIGAANTRLGAQRYQLERLRYKVYVRQAEHQPSIDRELRDQVGPAARVLYLQADICRNDLLLEIEAVGTPEPL